MSKTEQPQKKQRTAKQREASRRNGKMSKGPVTSAGKAISSRNHTVHGLCAYKNLILNNESPHILDILRDTYIDRYQPADPVELDIVEQMVSALWRLRRYTAVEVAVFDDEMARQDDAGFVPSYEGQRCGRAFKALAEEGNTLPLLGRYQARLTRDFHRARKSFFELRRELPPPPGSSPIPREIPPPIPGVNFPIEPEPNLNPTDSTAQSQQNTSSQTHFAAPACAASDSFKPSPTAHQILAPDLHLAPSAPVATENRTDEPNFAPAQDENRTAEPNFAPPATKNRTSEPNSAPAATPQNRTVEPKSAPTATQSRTFEANFAPPNSTPRPPRAVLKKRSQFPSQPPQAPPSDSNRCAAQASSTPRLRTRSAERPKCRPAPSTPPDPAKPNPVKPKICHTAGMQRIIMQRIIMTSAICLAAWGQGREEWTSWSVRPETMPKTARDGGTLSIQGAGNAAAYGGWRREASGVRPGQWYRLAASYRAQGVPAENWQVVARIDWLDGNGRRTGQPEYAAWARRAGEWTHIETVAKAPDRASSARLELLLANADKGDLRWRDVEFKEVPAPAARRIRVATVNLRPDRTGSAAESVRQFVETVEARVEGKVDLILLPEGITVVGTGKKYAEVAEPIPGPATETLAALARRRQAWVAAGIYERDGNVLYNTSVLLDREGRVAGKYRKVYLPREEVEAGLTPGRDYPVFRTDFGTVGMMICYDVFFPDPARALAAQGADLILLPIWGGHETLAAARAIENGVFLVASGYDHPTYIMDPDGKRVAWAPQRGEAAIATIDLERRYADQWLGDMRTRRLKEIRLDVPTPTPGLLR